MKTKINKTINKKIMINKKYIKNNQQFNYKSYTIVYYLLIHGKL